METLTPARSLDRRGTIITTFAVYDASRELESMETGEVLEIITDDFAPFRPDIAAWCESAGHRLVETVADGDGLHFFVDKQPPVVKDTKLAMVISSDGLEELLSPLGFALGAALEGIDVHLYFLGPAVRVLAGGFKPKLKGWGRPFSRFAAAGMTKAGHIPAQDKLRQLSSLGAHLYACGGSLPHFRVKPDEFIFDDISVVEYLTFMSVMEDSDIHMYV
ncbi:MAG: sulfurtransferase TusA family protein [Acidimicrobiia bacterium]|nr:sulfurtransferase TusA family protein [Acidimicrobiia bacterium]